MLEGAWVQKDEAMKALHKVLRYKFSLGQTTASTLHECCARGFLAGNGWKVGSCAQCAQNKLNIADVYSKHD